MTRVLIQDSPHRLGGHRGSGALRGLTGRARPGRPGPPGEAPTFGLGGGGLEFPAAAGGKG
ncbi:hypothetical protein [Actinocorallia populi]|uniref:hypothetical protein n=1 Tax=Actinocorallia populi TaxID=2079200 RepID=UPI000D0968BE|nr:hypothetical protein [Actinocorallia populi]